jgi:hypothetical protein
MACPVSSRYVARFTFGKIWSATAIEAVFRDLACATLIAVYGKPLAADNVQHIRLALSLMAWVDLPSLKAKGKQ